VPRVGLWVSSVFAVELACHEIAFIAILGIMAGHGGVGVFTYRATPHLRNFILVFIDSGIRLAVLLAPYILSSVHSRDNT
jgi:hypothetical protein